MGECFSLTEYGSAFLVMQNLGRVVDGLKLRFDLAERFVCLFELSRALPNEFLELIATP